ncbi:hypothetical protein HRJ34_21175 [Rhizorhabdus wittichii]|uniref:Uncharacterized protein n=1 Tax=Rhizorhabdus wittichii TaxID=160791 RepID=A0A975D097_9SPHN|nr:hypothetical protein [Rhizorhabdus wittichii]QTH20810.1 hypothetical protein HRJ34_21175 [Rhizorhabdus wittichii]
MGKTLGTVLTIGAAAALAYFSFGVAASFAALPGAATAGATAIAGAITALGVTATSFALQKAAGVLGLGPKAPRPPTAENAVKITLPERQAAYGRSKMAGWALRYDRD